jgi:hypothetical protein
MKTHRLLLTLTLTLVPALLVVTGGCSKADKDNASAVAQDIKSTAIDSWDSIKDFTYEKRIEFSASMDRMSASMDDNIAAAKAKFSGTPDAASKDKEAAIKDYDQARADLKARLIELNNATADTWADAKARVSDAWQRVKADYAKATS